MARRYDSALAFRVAVVQRLRNEAAASGVDIQRRRRQAKHVELKSPLSTVGR